MTELVQGYGSRVFGTLKLVPLDQIDIGPRGRKDYGDLDALKLSIAKNGLIHPIAIYSPTGLPPYKLAAGGRRLEACRALNLQGISCRIYDHELSPRDLKAIELFENLDRKELNYAEKISMEQELHNLLVSVEGPRLSGGNDKKGHALVDTAKLLGKDQSSLHKDFELGRMIKEHPELGLDKLKNKTQAYQVLKRLGSALGNKVMISQKRDELGDVEKQLIDSYVVGDFFDNDLEPSSYSFVECDPPYGIDLHHMRSANDKELLNTQYIEVPTKEYEEFIARTLAKLNYLAASSAWLVWWCGPTWYERVLDYIKIAGWTPSIVPAIWVKGSSPGQSLNPQLYLGNAYETFIYARRGNAQIHIMGHSNVFNHQPVFPGHKIHPAERPASLIKDILNTFCWPGSRVLVPFAGSGRTLVESHNLDLPAVGFDLSQEFKDAFVANILSGKEALRGTQRGNL